MESSPLGHRGAAAGASAAPTCNVGKALAPTSGSGARPSASESSKTAAHGATTPRRRSAPNALPASSRTQSPAPSPPSFIDNKGAPTPVPPPSLPPGPVHLTSTPPVPVSSPPLVFDLFHRSSTGHLPSVPLSSLSFPPNDPPPCKRQRPQVFPDHATPPVMPPDVLAAGPPDLPSPLPGQARRDGRPQHPHPHCSSYASPAHAPPTAPLPSVLASDIPAPRQHAPPATTESVTQGAYTLVTDHGTKLPAAASVSATLPWELQYTSRHAEMAHAASQSSLPSLASGPSSTAPWMAPSWLSVPASKDPWLGTTAQQHDAHLAAPKSMDQPDSAFLSGLRPSLKPPDSESHTASYPLLDSNSLLPASSYLYTGGTASQHAQLDASVLADPALPPAPYMGSSRPSSMPIGPGHSAATHAAQLSQSPLDSLAFAYHPKKMDARSPSFVGLSPLDSDHTVRVHPAAPSFDMQQVQSQPSPSCLPAQRSHTYPSTGPGTIEPTTSTMANTNDKLAPVSSHDSASANGPLTIMPTSHSASITVDTHDPAPLSAPLPTPFFEPSNPAGARTETKNAPTGSHWSSSFLPPNPSNSKSLDCATDQQWSNEASYASNDISSIQPLSTTEPTLSANSVGQATSVASAGDLAPYSTSLVMRPNTDITPLPPDSSSSFVPWAPLERSLPQQAPLPTNLSFLYNPTVPLASTWRDALSTGQLGPPAAWGLWSPTGTGETKNPQKHAPDSERYAWRTSHSPVSQSWAPDAGAASHRPIHGQPSSTSTVRLTPNVPEATMRTQMGTPDTGWQMAEGTGKEAYKVMPTHALVSPRSKPRGDLGDNRQPGTSTLPPASPHGSSSVPTVSSRCDYRHPLTATECGIEFARLYDLFRHRETIHAKEEASLVRSQMLTLDECRVLGKEVDLYRTLEEGQSRCTGEKGCGLLFSRRDALLRHKRLRDH